MFHIRSSIVAFCLGLCLSFVSWAAAAQGQRREVVIFAAASLKNALDEVVSDWARVTGEPLPKVSYAGSNTLARQIEHGAPADIFLSADADWMDYAQSRNLIVASSRQNLLRNRIVLISGQNGLIPASEGGSGELAVLLGNNRLAMAHVDGVPAGRYGKAALERLGLWHRVKAQVVQTENVRAALMLVVRGEVPLGIVYATDAVADANVRILSTFPDDAQTPILYPVALTRTSAHPAARRLIAHLASPSAAQIFMRHGFGMAAAAVPDSLG